MIQYSADEGTVDIGRIQASIVSIEIESNPALVEVGVYCDYIYRGGNASMEIFCTNKPVLTYKAANGTVLKLVC